MEQKFCQSCGMMKSYFPQLKCWRQTLNVSNDEVMNVNPALADVKSEYRKATR